MFSHDRFNELASLAAIGELSPAEHEEFERHKGTCAHCRSILRDTSSLASAAFLAGSPNHKDENAMARHQRLRENIAHRLPPMAPSFAQRYGQLIAAGVAAAFLLGGGIGVALGSRVWPRVAVQPATNVSGPAEAKAPDTSQAIRTENLRLQGVLSDLQKQILLAQRQNHDLQDKLTSSDQSADTLRAKFSELEGHSSTQAQELLQARNELNAAHGALAQTQATASAHEATINTLNYKLADREARLSEVTASVERGKEMLSAGREIRDIMGARDLHIVDVVDRDGKGRVRKAFGRAFYTQGKSLIFYAFDLPTKNTADGKFVYAAWGSNSNNLSSKVAHSLGIFYNDDQMQHRWAMKYDDPKVLEEIDTVFVTLEPSGGRFAAPTGKPLLEAYFGTPPNHP